MSGSGNLYGANDIAYAKSGTTQYGLLWRGAGSQIVYQFGTCPDYPICKGGASPNWGVSLDEDSNLLLGATVSGGTTGYGVAYGVDIGSGKETFAISFCRKAPNCQKDGGRPSSTLNFDATGSAYGTTYGGVDINSQGTLYQVNLAAHTMKVLHAFCPDGVTCSDGASPFGGVIRVDGSLFGTTLGGGANGYGTVYELTP